MNDLLDGLDDYPFVSFKVKKIEKLITLQDIRYDSDEEQDNEEKIKRKRTYYIVDDEEESQEEGSQEDQDEIEPPRKRAKAEKKPVKPKVKSTVKSLKLLAFEQVLQNQDLIKHLIKDHPTIHLNNSEISDLKPLPFYVSMEHNILKGILNKYADELKKDYIDHQRKKWPTLYGKARDEDIINRKYSTLYNVRKVLLFQSSCSKTLLIPTIPHRCSLKNISSIVKTEIEWGGGYRCQLHASTIAEAEHDVCDTYWDFGKYHNSKRIFFDDEDEAYIVTFEEPLNICAGYSF